MLVRLKVVDAHGRVLLVRRGRDGYGPPRMAWRDNSPRRLHVAVRECLKALFLDWHGQFIDFDAITAEHVVRHGTVVVTTLTGKALAFLPNMVNYCGGMVLAWPEEVDAGMVLVDHMPHDILDPPALPVATSHTDAA